MPLDYIRVVAVRSEKTHLGGGDYAETEGQIPGSPFLARVYRDAQKVFDRDEAGSGNASVDRMPRLSVKDAACPVREGDVWLVPQPGGGTRRASVLLARRYSDRTQYDLEMGAEGDAGASNSGAVPGPLGSPPAPAAQTQIDALTAQLTRLETDLMTSLRTASLPQIAENVALAQTTSAAPIAVPAAPITDYLVSPPVLSAARTDFAYSNAQGGRILKTTYRNPDTSTAAWTVQAPSGETFATTDGGAGLSVIIMQPGESRTMETTSATTAGQV